VTASSLARLPDGDPPPPAASSPGSQAASRMGAARRAPAWRSSCLALLLLPVVLPLVLLWLPLLCVAVAVVRFRRRRRTSRRLGEGGREAEEGAAHRAALLHMYLEDQVRLVEVDAAVDCRPTSCSQEG
jgi:hypothetical protein